MKIDLTGKETQYYTVIGRSERKYNKNVLWDCQCICGNIFQATTTDINKEKVKSCGCMKSKFLSEAHLQDLTNQNFGELFVIERDLEKQKALQSKQTFYKCQCSCGNVISVERGKLISRGQQSCGCKQSIGELHILKLLNSNNILFKTQYTNKDLATDKGGYLRYDFALLDESNNVIRLIEFDGPQHNTITQCWSNFNYENLHNRDLTKNNYAKIHNIPLVRVPYYKRDNLTLEDLLGNKFLVCE